jgi:hypothetical protein
MRLSAHEMRQDLDGSRLGRVDEHDREYSLGNGLAGAYLQWVGRMPVSEALDRFL